MSILTILGIDGSGKSTVSEKTAILLSGDAPAYLVSDRLKLYRQGHQAAIGIPVTERLRYRIGSYAKTAPSLKNYKIPKVAELLLRNHTIRQLAAKHRSVHLVLDGTPLLNMVAWARLYQETEFTAAACSQAIRILTGHASAVDRTDPVYRSFPELSLLKRLGFTRFVLPDRVIFLDVSPETALERISGRGRNFRPDPLFYGKPVYKIL